MKPAKFDYFAPTSLDEALQLLGQYGSDAKVLAGGQSLMPLMAMRLVRPAVVIDINRIAGLAGISADDEAITLGALTRQRALERSGLVQESLPLVAAAIPHIGHFQIRNRGTVGGSLAHADPAAEIPALCLALDAEFTVVSSAGERTASARDFFVGLLTTALEPEQMLYQVRIPRLSGRWRWGFREVSRRDGDFAMVGAIALVRLDDQEVCQEARITMFGVGETPLRINQAEEALRGGKVDDEARRAAAALVSGAVAPGSDIHASAEYRTEVSGVMARRALEDAMAISG
jgi:CO/xanthine dehydrogenase FAD-binding subunit